PEKIDIILQHILLLHSIIFSFGGIPLIYYGDELGTINDYSYIEDISKANDSRWAHRPRIDWEQAMRRKQRGTVEYKIFNALKKMIAVRKKVSEFSDFNNRKLLEISNPELLAYVRFNIKTRKSVLVVGNFDAHPQYLNLFELETQGFQMGEHIRDLYSGNTPTLFKDQLVLPPIPILLAGRQLSTNQAIPSPKPKLKYLCWLHKRSYKKTISPLSSLSVPG
ncbi:MAG TPA: hypothetical protein PLF65_12435, partial [Desulfobacter postgatei]|nr:hypothetical protein [Desulfobacter postgatei]